MELYISSEYTKRPYIYNKKWNVPVGIGIRRWENDTPIPEKASINFWNDLSGYNITLTYYNVPQGLKHTDIDLWITEDEYNEIVKHIRWTNVDYAIVAIDVQAYLDKKFIWKIEKAGMIR